MAYNNSIPQPTDQLSQSQSDILGNFQALQTLIDVNHVDFSSGDQGKHKWVTFPVQGSAPSFNSGEVGLYNFSNSITSVNELYITNSSGTSTALTASLKDANGWTYLPSGILLMWGSTTTSAGSNTISFPTGATYPTFTAVLSMQLSTGLSSPANTDSFVILNSFNSTSFTVYSSQRTANAAAASGIWWLAIGY